MKLARMKGSRENTCRGQRRQADFTYHVAAPLWRSCAARGGYPTQNRPPSGLQAVDAETPGTHLSSPAGGRSDVPTYLALSYFLERVYT